MYLSQGSVDLSMLTTDITGNLGSSRNISKLLKFGFVPIASVIQDVFDDNNNLLVGS